MEIQESETLYDTNNPQWGSAFDFEVYDDNIVSATCDATIILWHIWEYFFLILVWEETCHNYG